jgi:Sec-independent protein secretion pathway component TatC
MMAVHGPSGVGVVAASTYPASERRAMFVLSIVIEAVFTPMEEVIDSDILRMDSCK